MAESAEGAVRSRYELGGDVKISVYHPSVSRGSDDSSLNWGSHELQPYAIEVQSTQGIWRVYRHFQSVNALLQSLSEWFPGELPAIASSRRLFGKLFGGDYADTEGAETRRTTVAERLQKAQKLCGAEENEANRLLHNFLTADRLFSAVEKGDADEVRQLLESQTQTVWDTEPTQWRNSLHFLCHCARQGRGDNHQEIGNLLLSLGADPLALDKNFESPLMVALSAVSEEQSYAPKDLHEEWQSLATTLVAKGANLLEVASNGDSLMHRAIHYADLLKEIVDRVDRLKDHHNHNQVTPYTLASDVADKPVQSFLRSVGARKERDFEVISEALEEQMKQFDGFLEEARNRGDQREIISLLLRQADLQLLDRPMETAKILNCALYLSMDMQRDREEIYEKLIQAYQRVAFIHQCDLNLPEVTTFTDLLMKRRTKMKEVRGNIDYSFEQMPIQQALGWMSDQFNTIIKNAISDALSFLAPPPCPYAILVLGPHARRQASPSNRIQFALLVRDPTNYVLEYFRMFIRLFELSIINLQETPYKVLQYGTVSPIAPGLRFDYGGNVPGEMSNHTAFSFLGSPYQLAQAQEPRYYKENANPGSILWESGLIQGDKKLYETFRTEMDRVLGRKDSTQTRSLRQQRAVNMIRTDIQDSIPKMNRDIEAEDRFEFHRFLVSFPVRIITWLCLYYKIDIVNISLWDRVDRLCSAGVLSKEGAKNLKICLSSVMELYLRAGEKKIMDIKTAKKEYSKANPPYDSDGEEVVASVEQDDEEDDDPSTFQELELETDESAADALQAKKKKQKMEKAKMYVLNATDVDQIAEAYKTILPLQAALKEWLNEENREGEKANMKSHTLYNDSDSALAETYLRMCHYEKAKFHFRAAIEQDASDFTALNTFGVMWNKLGNYKKAIKYYEKAVRLIEKEKGTDAPQLATQYNNLAMANVNLHQNLEAIEWLEKALKVDEKVYGEKHPFVARDYRNIGLMALKESQFEKAEEYLRRGLAIDSKHFGEVSSQVANYYNDLGRVFEAQERYDESISHYNKALEVDRQLYAEANPIIASRHLSLASIYRAQSKMEDSLVQYEKALAVYEAVHGDEHLTVASTMFQCGSISAEMDNLEKALDYLKDSYESFKKLKGEKDSETLVAYKKMKEVEELLRQKLKYGDEYEKWKQAMEEKRRRASEEQLSGKMEMEVEEREQSDDELEPAAPKIYGPGSVQKCKKSVFDDDFFDL